jgi:hypothetical protein
MVSMLRIVSSGMLCCVGGLTDRLFQRLAVASKCHDLLTPLQSKTSQKTESSFY